VDLLLRNMESSAEGEKQGKFIDGILEITHEAEEREKRTVKLRREVRIEVIIGTGRKKQPVLLPS